MGPNFIEFTSREGKSFVCPMDYIRSNYPQILDKNGRLDLRSGSITPEIQVILDEAIATSVASVYEQSMAMNMQQASVRRSA